MGDRFTVRDLERIALVYAVREREGLIYALEDSTSPSDVRERERAQALVAGWKAMLRRRHGVVDAVPSGRRVDIFTLAAEATTTKT